LEEIPQLLKILLQTALTITHWFP